MLKNRWDYAWKALCNPNAPWGPMVISALVGPEFANYNVDFSMAEAFETEQQQHVDVGVRVADKFIKVTVDSEKRILHFEFQSTYDHTICWRMLNYDLNLAKTPSFEAANIEEYTLPHSTIINVKSTGLSKIKKRILVLKIGDDRIEIPYRVVNGYEAIPEIGELIEATNIEQCVEIVTRLGNRCNGFSSESSWSEQYMSICAALASPGVYDDDGADEYSVKEVYTAMQKQYESLYDFALRKGLEQGLEQGLEKGSTQKENEIVRNLMENMGWTEAQARDAVTSKGARKRESGGDLKRMNL